MASSLQVLVKMIVTSCGSIDEAILTDRGFILVIDQIDSRSKNGDIIDFFLQHLCFSMKDLVGIVRYLVK